MPAMPAPGDLLGNRYRIDSPLGSGGMAEVWRARDLVLNRAVAVKVPRSDWPEELTARLLREARAAAGLGHPSITGVHDFGESDLHGARIPYVVMELLDGETLAARLARGPLPLQEAAGVCARIADALAAAHAAGVVHRDVKPENVFLTPVGVKVLDFGIAFTGTSPGSGRVIGTPAYVAPELRAGAEPTPAADVYALGVILRQALLGGPPSAEFGGLHELPDGIGRLLRSALATSPDARPEAAETARVLADAAGIDLAPLPTAPPPAAPAPEPEPNPTRVLDEPAPRPSPKRPLMVVGAAVGAVTLVGLLPAALSSEGERPAAAPPETPSAKPATPSPTASPTGARTRCSVTYTLDGSWPNGFQATVRITNLGDAPVDGWRLAFAFPDGQRVTQIWNGGQEQQGPAVTVTAAPYNRSIAPGGTVEFGFLGSRDGGDGEPSGFTLNGGRCVRG
ncbi:protein kinase domain-containing protein [Spirillospora albida]|uniref:protein kinase domain-containing protein n=1 Tax=Spirillospora albida TaxID=58123 RepID=UPI00068DD4A8|nr:cellulose binding domain-containing protein [Spirillospora albida]